MAERSIKFLPRVRDWLKKHLHLDMLFALRENTFAGLRQLLEPYFGPKDATSYRRKPNYVPIFEQLEVRQMPSTVQFQFDEYTVEEDEGTKALVVALDAASATTITVDFATSDDTAFADVNYEADNGTLTFSPGQTSKTITLTILDDNVYSHDVWALLTLSNATNATIGNNNPVPLTIENTDDAPSVEFVYAKAQWADSVIGFSSEFSSEDGAAAQALGAPDNLYGGDNAWRPSTQNSSSEYLSVEFETPVYATGLALRETSGNGFVTQIDLIDTDDTLHTVWNDTDMSLGAAPFDFWVEFTETTYLVKGAKIYIDGSLNTDEWESIDAVQLFSPLATNYYSVDEDAESVTAVVKMSAVSRSEASVNFTTVDDSARNPTDYQGTGRTVTFLPGERIKTFAISIIDDDTNEAEQSFGLALLRPCQSTLGTQSTADVVIADEDNEPTIEFSDTDFSVSEADGLAVITVELSSASEKSITVQYATSNGTGTAGTDYSSTSGTLTFAPGETTKTFFVLILQNNSSSDDKTVDLTLSNPANADLGTNDTATLTIGNAGSDPPTARFSALAYSVSESSGSATISVTLNAATATTVTLDYDTSDGTASSSSDYTAASGTLTFAPNETAKTFTVSITNDSIDEESEILYLSLSNASNASLGDAAVATLAIADNDSAPSVAFEDEEYTSPLTSGWATVVVELSTESERVVTIAYHTVDITAIAGVDYAATNGVVTISPGDTTATISIQTYSSQGLADVKFEVLLDTPDNAVLGTSIAATVTLEQVVWSYQHKVPLDDAENGARINLDQVFAPVNTMFADFYRAAPTITSAAAGPATPIQGTANVSPYSGQVLISHPLDLNVSPTVPTLGGDPALVFDGLQVDARPIIGVTVPTTLLTQTPHHFTVDLYWNGRTDKITSTYRVRPGTSPGTTYSLPIQVDEPVETTGYYPYTVRVNAYYTSNDKEPRASDAVSGFAAVVTNEYSPFGAGWSLNGFNRLFHITEGTPGELLIYGGGGYRFFEDAGNGNYSTPTGDFGTLTFVESASQFRYVAKDRTKWTFDEEGKLLSIASMTDGTRSFSYDSNGRLASISDFDGTAATFVYESGSVKIEEPGNSDPALGLRTVTLTLSGTSLTQITNPDGGTHSFGYSGKKIASETMGPVSHSFTYSSITERLIAVSVNGVSATFTPVVSSPLEGTRAQPVQNVTNHVGEGLTYDLDANGRVTSVTSAAFQETYELDSNGQFANIHGAEGQLVTRNVDSFGSLTSERTPDGNWWNYSYDSELRTLTSIQDPIGGTTNYYYDSVGRLTGVSDPMGHLTTFLFAGPYLLSETNANGARTTFGRASNYHMTSMTDATGNVTAFAYDSMGNQINITDPRNLTVTKTYDVMRRLLSIEDADGHVTTFTYNSLGWMTSKLDSDGRQTNWAYNAWGKITSITEAVGTSLQRVTTNYFDAKGRLTATVDARGYTTTYASNESGRMTMMTDPLGNRTYFEHDAYGNITLITDALGRETAFIFDTMKRRIQATDALGNVSSTLYDALGNVTLVRDFIGNGQIFLRDAGGRITVIVNSDGRTTLALDPVGNVTAQTNPRGFTTNNLFDAANRLTVSIDPLGHSTYYEYDGVGNAVSVTDARGNTTLTEFDAYNRKTQVTTPLGHTTQYFYDASGNLTLTIDANENETAFLFDALNRKTVTIDALGNRTTLAFDPNDNLIQTTDARGNTTAYSYNAANHMTSLVDAMANVFTMLNDKVGNQTSITDNRGYTTTLAYDALNRQTIATNPLGKTTVRYYDAAGHVTGIQDANGNLTSYGFDWHNRPTGFSVAGTYVYRNYDGAGNLVQLSTNAGTTNYLYDAANHLTVTIDALGNRTSFVVDNVGNPVQKTNARGYVSLAYFDADNRLTRIIDEGNAVHLRGYDGVGNLTSETDARNFTTNYVFDALNRQTVVIDALGNRTTKIFDAGGNLTQVTDARGFSTKVVFDALNRQSVTIDALGDRTTQILNIAGKPTTVIDARGNATQYYYDQADRVTLSVDALNRVHTFATDNVGNVTAVIDPRGYTTRFLVDGLNRATVVIDPLQYRTTIQFDGSGNEVAFTDKSGFTRLRMYDALNRLVNITDYIDIVYGYEFDSVGNLVSVSVGNGGTTTFAYDPANHRTAAYDGLGFATLFVNDANGNPIQSTNARGYTSIFSYDALNRVTTATDPIGATTLTYYDQVGNVTGVRDPNGNLTQRLIDGLNRTTVVIDALGNRATTVFDPVGNIVQSAAPGGASTQFLFDAANRQTVVVDALGYRTTNLVDGNGNATVQVDARGNSWLSTFDAGNRRTQTTNPVGFTTAYYHDANGNVTGILDARNNLTQISFDALNRKRGETDALGNTWSVNFISERISSIVDQRGYSHEFTYDVLGRLTHVNDLSKRWATFVYDAVGNVTGAIEQRGFLTQYTYDAANRKSAEIDPNGATTGYSSDANGNITGILNPRGYTTTFAYDALNRIVTEQLGGLSTLTYYNAAGNVTLLIDAAGFHRSYQYDALGRQTAVTLGPAASIDFSKMVAFDAVGNIQSETDGNNHTTQYVYDAANRRASSTDPLGSVTNYYSDSVGNLTGVKDARNFTHQFVFDAANRLTVQIDPLGYRTTYLLDPIGNITANINALGYQTSYTYTWLNQIASITDPLAHTESYQYDAAGNRISFQDKNAHATQYLFDPDNRLTATIDPMGYSTVRLHDGVDNVTGVINPRGYLTQYSYNAANQRQTITDPLGFVSTERYDGLGHLTQAIDARGNATAYSYNALGLLTNTTYADSTQIKNSYDAAGNLTMTHDVSGGWLTYYGYDAANRKTSQTEGAGSTYPVTTQYLYDAVGNATGMRDGLNNLTQCLFDANNRQTTITDPLGYSRLQLFDAVGNVTGTVNERGYLTAHTYDGLNRLIAETDPLQHTTGYEYDAVGNRTAITDGRGVTTHFVFDANDRLSVRYNPTSGAIGPYSPRTTYLYDAVGNVTMLINPRSYATRHYYNAADRLTLTIDALNGQTLFGFDGNGNRTSQTDPLGNATQFGYDVRNRLTITTDPLGNATRQYFDSAGNITAHIDALGNAVYYEHAVLNRVVLIEDGAHSTEFVYDAAGRLTAKQESAFVVADTSYEYNARGDRTAVVDPLGHRSTSLFDPAHNVTAVIDANGHLTAYQFDAANRATSITNPLGFVTLQSFDGVGNLTTVTDARGFTTTFSYDAENRFVGIQRPIGGAGRSYDENGNLTYDSIPDGIGFEYTYDALDRRRTTTDARGFTTTHLRDAVGNVTMEIGPRGFATYYQNDADRRRTGTTDAAGGQSYTRYDAIDRVTEVIDANGHSWRTAYDRFDRVTSTTNPLGNTRTTDYADPTGILQISEGTTLIEEQWFDAASRLTTVRHFSSFNTSQANLHYYDAVGNLTGLVDFRGNLTQFVYDAADQRRVSIDALGHRATSILDPVGNATAVINERGFTSQFVFDAINRMTVQIDALGHATTFELDYLGNPLVVIDANDNRVTRTFDALSNETSFATEAGTTYKTYDQAGNLVTFQDINGATTSFLYDAINRQTAIIDAYENTTAKLYDHVANVTQVTDANGGVTEHTYNAADLLTSTTTPMGFTTAYTFNNHGMRTSVTDANGHTTSFAYDAWDHLLRTIDALNHTTTYLYDGNGNLVSVEDSLANVTGYVFDALDRRTAVVDHLGHRTTTGYDAVGNIVSHVDPLGNTTQYQYDAADRQTAAIDALSNVTAFAHDPVGNVTSVTDANGNTTLYVYDGANRRIVMIDALGGRTTTSYSGMQDQQTSVTNPLGNTISTDYDLLFRLSSFVDALGNTTTYLYDAVGNQTAVIDALGNLTERLFDADNRLTAVVDPLSHAAQTAYDAAGNVTAQTDALGHATLFVYDAADRRTAVVDALGARTTTFYDAAGNVTGVMDASANRTTFTLDGDYRKTQSVDAAGNLTTYAFDAADRLVAAIDPLGRIRSFYFDALGRLTLETWSPEPGTTVAYVTLTYDAVGNQASAANANGAYQYSYDELNRVASVSQPFGVTQTFLYDAAGNRTLTTDSLGGVTTSVYDAANRLIDRRVSQDEAADVRVTYQYDAVNRVTGVLAGGLTTAKSYDAAGRLTVIVTTAANGRVTALYDFDAANRVTQENINGALQTYTYDAANQLTADSISTVTYDATGNRDNDDNTAGAANQLITDGLWSFTYDPAGNVVKKSQGTGDETWIYEFDYRNQLTLAQKWSEDPDVVGTAVLQLEASYAHDAYGNRIEKAVDDDGSGSNDAVTTHFVFDCWKVEQDSLGNRTAYAGLENCDVIADLDGDNDDALLVRYAFSDRVDAPAARIDASGEYIYGTDRLGSVIAIASGGDIIGTLAYDGYGNLLSNTVTAIDDRKGWTGRDRDDEIGMQDNRQREYDPQTARWMSQDPEGFAAGDINLYRYVGNNFTNFTDPSGLVRFGRDLDPNKYFKDLLETKKQEKDRSFDPIYQTMGISVPIDTPSAMRNFVDSRIRGGINDPAVARSIEISTTPPTPNSAMFRGDTRIVALLMDEEQLRQLERRAAEALTGSGSTPAGSIFAALTGEHRPRRLDVAALRDVPTTPERASSTQTRIERANAIIQAHQEQQAEDFAREMAALQLNVEIYGGGRNLDSMRNGLAALGRNLAFEQEARDRANGFVPWRTGNAWMDGVLNGNARMGGAATNGGAALYGEYWDGQARTAGHALGEVRPYLEIGVNIVAASWTLGPAALIGNTDILRHALQFGALNVGFDGLAQTAAILDGRQTEYNWLQGANSFAQGVYLSSGMAIPGVRQVLTGYFTSESVHGAAEAWRNGDSYTALVHGLGAVVGGLDLAGSARSAWSATRSTISDAWSSGPRGNVRMFDPFGAALGEGSARARGGVEPRRAPDSAGAYRSDPAPAPMDFGPNWAEGSPRGRAFEVSWAMDSAPRARPFEGIMDSGVRPGEASGPRIFDESALSNRPMQRGEGMAEPARGLPDQTRYGEQRTRRPGEFDPRDVHRQGLYDADPATNARMQAEVEGRLRDMGFTPEEARSVAEQGGRQGTNGKAILDAINSGEIAEWRVRSGNQGAIANLLDRVGVKIDGEATISRSRYPETAKHVADAQKAGHPDVLEIDRPNADSRRSDSLAGHQKVSGMQLDEYPPAMFKEGGTGASVRAISPEDNMGAGASMGNQLRRFPNGARIRIRVVK